MKYAQAQNKNDKHQIRIGPAGWSYTDWEGTVYPPHGSRFDPLAYLSSFFDTIEINSPFYRIPPPSHSKSWIRRVSSNPDFKFTTKIFRGFTHERAQPGAEEIKAFRNYLDPKEELAPWVERIQTMAREKETYVITNNHFRGQAIVNAADLKDALGQMAKMPPQLKEVYGERVH